MRYDFVPAVAGGALALLLAVAPASAETEAARPTPAPPPIPDRADAAVLKDAPAEWREYLIAARKADRVSDPLRRCLAFPDLPGTRWPQGHAEAHCRFHAISAIGLDEIAVYLDRGDADGLEKRMRIYLAKHFSDEDFGEDIHIALADFSDATPKQTGSRRNGFRSRRPALMQIWRARPFIRIRPGMPAAASGRLGRRATTCAG